MDLFAERELDLDEIAFNSAVKKADKLYARSKGMPTEERTKISSVIDKELFEPVDELHESLKSTGEKRKPWILADVLYARIDRLYNRCEAEVERLLNKTSSSQTAIGEISKICDSLDSSFLKTQNGLSPETSDGSGYLSDNDDTMQPMDVSSGFEGVTEEECAETKAEKIAMETDEIYKQMCEEMCKGILSDIDDVEMKQ